MASARDGEAAVPNRAIITVCAMVATLMQALDGTIANVALPYMQGGLAASADQITWVLTSYITASAILTAPVGFLAARFGRKAVFLVSVGGFTLASVLCGAAQSLEQMVAFRLLQGAFGAALVPLSQSTMLDIYPPSQRGQAMAIWGMGVMIGPILGPTLGGLLTESLNWRWVFYVNLPFGVLAFAGLLVFLPREDADSGRGFDWLGFGVLALGIGALQVMLDRGELQNWFGSIEIIIEATLAGLGIYLFLVHMATAERPFIPPRIFRDRNFLAGMGVMFVVGAILFSTAALLAPYLQTLGNYPVFTAGLMLAPRGLGTMTAMLIAGRLASRFDPRVVMLFGILLLTWTLYDMTGWTPDVSEWTLVMTTILQGMGLGFVFIPLNVLAFATLEPALRTDGTSLVSLMRNLGSAIGISVMAALLTRNTQVNHAELAVHVSPLNRVFDWPVIHHWWNPATTAGRGVAERRGDAAGQHHRLWQRLQGVDGADADDAAHAAADAPAAPRGSGRRAACGDGLRAARLPVPARSPRLRTGPFGCVAIDESRPSQDRMATGRMHHPGAAGAMPARRDQSMHRVTQA